MSEGSHVEVELTVVVVSPAAHYCCVMSQARSDVLVIGAGVSGLTTAIALAEAGVAVRVLAERLPVESTSCAAGAIWGPYLVSHDHIDLWSWQTFEVLQKLAARERTGVRMCSGIEASRSLDAPPDWATRLPGFRLCAVTELPDGFVSGWRYTVPVVDMPVYLGYLMSRLGAAGGGVERGHVASLDDTAGRAAVVVNCAGFGARALVPDPELTPVRGQLAVALNPGIDEFFAEYGDEAADLTYFLPQGDHVILGGSAEPGRWEMHADQATIDAIVRRCEAIEPRLRGARVVGSRVGVRPSRPHVRVEHVALDGRHVIHNYGHGGAGVSLSWGCAYEVRDVANGLIGP
jgi:D-amino-acid oxidase